MKRRDRAVVAIILAAALVVGLRLVAHGLSRAQLGLEASLSVAQFNGGDSGSGAAAGGAPGGAAGEAAGSAAGEAAGSAAGEATGSAVVGTAGGTAVGAGESAASEGADEAAGVAVGGAAGGAAGGDVVGAAGEAAGGDVVGAAGGTAVGAGESAGGEAAGGATVGATGGDEVGAAGSAAGDAVGDFSLLLDQAGETSASVPFVLPTDMGNPPSMGGGEVTLAELTHWMQNESIGALAAQIRLEAESALGRGVGSESDALRRNFAQIQSTANDQARQSLLAQEAASLGIEYLKCRDLLALREESLAFYKALEAAIGKEQAAAESWPADKEQTADEEPLPDPGEKLQADRQTAKDAVAAAEIARAEAEADLKAAAEALNAAVGNPANTVIAVTGKLLADALPTFSADAAAALALETRNEIKAAAYTMERERQALNQLRYQYPPTAPEFLSRQSALEEAQAAYPRIKGTVESDVRDRLTRLQLSAQDLELAATALEHAGTAGPEPAYKLKIGSDQTWSSNLTALMGQWAERLSGRLRLITGTARLNLDILLFHHAVGVGYATAVI